MADTTIPHDLGGLGAELDGDDGRGELRRRFAETLLRRLPRERDAGDAELAVDQVKDAFDLFEQRTDDAVAVRVGEVERGLDGDPLVCTTVEIAAPDQPFLLSTVVEELKHRNLTVRRSLHPIYGVDRSDDGRITDLHAARHAERRESFIHVELVEPLEPDLREELSDRLEELLADVRVATDDYQAMQERVREVVEELRSYEDDDHAEEAEEAAALLEWLLADNFVLLGWREYAVVDDDGRPAIEVVEGSGLGLLRDESSSRFASPQRLQDLPQELRRRFHESRLLTVSRTNARSTVRRRTRMDYVGVKVLRDGEVVGERRLLGLFTSKATSEPARATPVLRRKLETILEREDVVPGSHDEHTIKALFEAMPKDELFQADVDTLHQTVLRLREAEEHGETQVLVRIERFTRTVSILVAVPRDRYSPDVRRELQRLFLERFDGERVTVDVALGDREETVARFTVQVGEHIPDVDPEELREEVVRRTRTWRDDLEDECREQRGGSDAAALLDLADLLPRSYRDVVPPRRAVADLDALSRLLDRDLDLAIVLRRPRRDDGLTRLKALRAGDPLVLSDVLPILESLGLTIVEELPFALRGGPEVVHLHDFGVRDDRGVEIDVANDGHRLAAATAAAWRGRLEVDSLNRLVLRAGLDWRQVAVLRAYRRLRRQLGTAYTPDYINDTLVERAEISAAMLDYFEARFDPEGGDPEAAREAAVDLLDEVDRLDHDRIIRGILVLIDATLRTNAYRDDAVADDGPGTPYLSFKLDSTRIPDLPAPVPYREVYVYSPRVEGVHLRGGPIARGGLRASDRMDDVRTEVLGLMRAQMIKNAVIVPTGAKGGFVLKRPPEAPGARREEVRRQYVTFIRGLLDVTDNIVDGEIVPPPDVRRHDGDDPYLVVAADKGTATFSDLANEIADRYDFWLGDAFASGGSHGYDHKRLGITARGAWVAVQRHFHELGVDVQSESITVVGVGDMSGDVFGNGMLLSPAIKLVAAFDHRDIFLDPDPDPARAYAERRRLFDDAGSTWQDYDRDAISEGGGVYARTAKRVEVSDAVRELLRLDTSTLTPPELIRAVLSAPVDLLFAGGIGTYVKASQETHDEVGDRANDEIRIDATDVRARVIGEGANLAVTPQGRVQYSRRGGRINQDAIDNAGGVDISDHEVNLKILLREAVADGDIDREERDRLLDEVTEDVVGDVLRNVDRQTWMLSAHTGRSAAMLDAYARLMNDLVDEGALDREVSALPDDEDLDARREADAGLTRPELASVSAAVKRRLATVVTDSDLPDQQPLQRLLDVYFPRVLTARFPELTHDHRLRRELIAMMAANGLIDRMGPVFASRLAHGAGVRERDVVAAYWVARTMVDADRLWPQLDALVDVLPHERLLSLDRTLHQLVDQLTRAYLADDLSDLAAVIERDRPVASAVREGILDLGTSQQRNRRRERANALMDDLIDEPLAITLASAQTLGAIRDVATVSRSLPGHDDPLRVAGAFLRMGAETGLDQLERRLEECDVTGRWPRAQREGLMSDLRRLRVEAVVAALSEAEGLGEPDAVERHLARRRERLERARDTVRHATSADDGLNAIAVAVRALRDALEGT